MWDVETSQLRDATEAEHKTRDWTGGMFASADRYWSVPRASRPQWILMTLSGTTAHARVDRIAGTTLTWWVNALSDTARR